jgi:hypothetical protein
MRKIVPVLLLLWLVIGIASFAVWWKIVRNISNNSVLMSANEIARQMDAPWAIRFKDLKPTYGASFNLVINDIEIINMKGDKVLTAKRSVIRVPWMVFFKKSPTAINIFFEDVDAISWNHLLSEVESYLERKKDERYQEVSLPKHIVDSKFNLRFNRLEGKLNGESFNISKFYLLNVNPKTPTTFEVVFPWHKQINHAQLDFETKVLGEYRVSKQKVDLHFFLKNRLQLTKGEQIRNGEFSVEGKGFYHSRLGFFSTLSTKDDWISLVGDIEWNENRFSFNLPRFSLSSEFLLDLSVFEGYRQDSTTYRSSAIGGELRYEKNNRDSKLAIKANSRKTAKIQTSKGTKPLVYSLNWSLDGKVESQIVVDNESLFSLKSHKNESYLKYNSNLLLASEPDDWKRDVSSLIDSIKIYPWSIIQITDETENTFKVTRKNNSFDISGYKIHEDYPTVNLSFNSTTSKIEKLSFSFSNYSINDFLEKLEVEPFLMVGFPLTGIVYKDQEKLKLKSSWSGPILPLIAKSSCRALLAEREELSFLNDSSFIHSAEIEKKNEQFTILSWNAKNKDSSIKITGDWSNSPIECDLNIALKKQRQKEQNFSIVLK